MIMLDLVARSMNVHKWHIKYDHKFDFLRLHVRSFIKPVFDFYTL